MKPSTKRHGEYDASLPKRAEKWIWILVIALMAFSLPCEARRKKKKHRAQMDPLHAEEILARFSKRMPLGDDEWVKILGERKASTYSIVAGDTLWSVANKTFKNPFLWRKLWEENPYLTNPHELEPGQTLTYYKEPSERSLASEAIPVIKLRPYGRPSDLDNGTFSPVILKNRYRPMMFVIAKDNELLGELTGSYTSGDVLSELNYVYLDLRDHDKVIPGDRFSLVHIERTVRDRTKDEMPVLGTLVRLVGEVTILDRGDELALARIDSVSGRVRRGDKVIALQKSAEPTAPVNPPNHLQLNIVLGEEDEYKAFAQGQLVLLNKGANDGVQNGFYFRVYRDTDPFNESDQGVEPASKGEIQIVYTGEVSSLGMIVRNSEPLYIGDTLVPRQTFLEPEPIPRKSTQSMEID